jgi:hypothetical protein
MIQLGAWIIAGIWTFFTVTVPAASAEQRRALVIGAQHYQYVPSLEKAEGDARAMKAALERLEFELTSYLIQTDGISTPLSSLFAQKTASGRCSTHTVLRSWCCT